MQYLALQWQGPFPLATFDFSHVPPRPGVYVFTEYNAPLTPNFSLPAETDEGYEDAITRLRLTPCVLYVGKAANLSTRLPGYRFRPYLEIQRRPEGTPPKHTTSRHKGRALMHAQQFFDGPVYLQWAETSSPGTVEDVLNTVGMP